MCIKGNQYWNQANRPPEVAGFLLKKKYCNKKFQNHSNDCEFTIYFRRNHLETKKNILNNFVLYIMFLEFSVEFKSKMPF